MGPSDKSRTEILRLILRVSKSNDCDGHDICYEFSSWDSVKQEAGSSKGSFAMEEMKMGSVANGSREELELALAVPGTYMRPR